MDVMTLKETGCVGVECIQLAQYRVEMRALVSDYQLEEWPCSMELAASAGLQSEEEGDRIFMQSELEAETLLTFQLGLRSMEIIY
jgi:hypothetical protein